MTRPIILMTAITALAIAHPLHAQQPAPVVVTQPVNNNYSPYGFYGYGGGHASTAAEGYMNGMGNVIQSAGSYNLQTSQAAMNMEQARTQNIDNNLKFTQTYFEMRKINSASRKAEESPGLTTEDSWRYAQMRLPKRLTPMELDPVTGKIYWPTLLNDPRFDQQRKQLDQLFVQRETAHGSIGYDTYMQIKQSTDALLADLKTNISTFPNSSDYV